MYVQRSAIKDKAIYHKNTNYIWGINITKQNTKNASHSLRSFKHPDRKDDDSTL